MDHSTEIPDKTDAPMRTILSKKYRKAFWVLVCIVLGNVSYYMMRAHYNLAQQNFKESKLLNSDSFGTILMFTYVVNMIGKPLGGWIADQFNRPKLGFVTFIFLTVACTISVTFLVYYEAIAAFWTLGRLFTTMGRMNVIKIVAFIFPSHVMGTVMGIVTVSCSLGEAFAKLALSQMLRTLTWQQMFYGASGITFVLMLPTIIYVSDVRINKGCKNEVYEQEELDKANSEKKNNGVSNIPPMPTVAKLSKVMKEPHTSPLSTNTEIPILESSPPSIYQNCKTIFSKPRFLILLLMSCLITVMKEMLGSWSLDFMMAKNGRDIHKSDAGSISSVFSLLSAFSAMVAGRSMDTISRRHRGSIFSGYLLGLSGCMLTVSLLLLNIDSWSAGMKKESVDAVICSILVIGEFFMGPPSSFIDGIFVYDLVEQRLVSFASGLVGSLGYIGGIVVTPSIKNYAKRDQYVELWAIGAGCGFLCFAVSLVYYYMDNAAVKRAEKHPKRVGEEVGI